MERHTLEYLDEVPRYNVFSVSVTHAGQKIETAVGWFSVWRGRPRSCPLSVRLLLEMHLPSRVGPCTFAGFPGEAPRPPSTRSQAWLSSDSILRLFYARIQIPFYPARGHKIHVENTWISSSRKKSGLVCFEVFRGADCFQYWEKVAKIRY